MNLKFQTTFVVMPDDCNYMLPMVFGGKFFAQMDLAAASCVTRLIRDNSPTAKSAVTYKFEGTFHGAAQMGDLIFLEAEIIPKECHTKSVVVEVKAYREKRTPSKRDFIAEAKFVFVTKNGEKFVKHELKFNETTRTSPCRS